MAGRIPSPASSRGTGHDSGSPNAHTATSKHVTKPFRSTLLVVGAGPCGLAVGTAASSNGVSCVLVDRGPVVHALERFPIGMTWFSTPELLEIGGVPFVTAGDKPSREEALKYYRRVATDFDLDIRQYEDVRQIERIDGGSLFEVETRSMSGETRMYHAQFVVVAIGSFDTPNLLGVEGEQLEKVNHYFREPHRYFDQDVLVIGGSNSAVESALACWRAGARVTVVHRGVDFGRGVKLWILPDMLGRMKAGEIDVLWDHKVIRIEHDRVLLRSGSGGTETWLPNDFVLAMTGFHPDRDCLAALGVTIDPETGVPHHDPETMETPTPGLFIAGVLAAGKDGNSIFIENGREHGARIFRCLKHAVVDGV
ncbi:MAG: YpdA family putative bacillithiol disulfide reductase [Gemmatimonadales bacterium]|nr:MAG: YpdA family putative bacillithiol disulfide reductase [Gemmatimonadales bacterium]